MNRREFIGFGVMALAVLPASLSALDYRKEKPAAWKAKTVDSALEALYGKQTYVEKGIKLKIPKVASNGGAIPVDIKSKIDAKSVAVFQDSNPESAVAVFTVPEGQPVNYSIKIKMKKSGAITIVVEGKDGKFYKISKSLEVALGGCEG